MINDYADSGHSGQVLDRHDSEEDGQDECQSDPLMYLYRLRIYCSQPLFQLRGKILWTT